MIIKVVGSGGLDYSRPEKSCDYSYNLPFDCSPEASGVRDLALTTLCEKIEVAVTLTLFLVLDDRLFWKKYDDDDDDVAYGENEKTTWKMKTRQKEKEKCEE